MATEAARFLEQLLAAHGAEDAFVQDAEDAEDECAVDDEAC